MRAHANDLRAEVAADFGISDPKTGDSFVHALASDWRRAELGPADRALCSYADILTAEPHRVGDGEIAELRRCGFGDTAIHDATQIVGYFNYINRVADALGVDQESFVRAWEADDVD